MRILINGLPLFSSRLAKDLKEFDASSSFIFCNTYYSIFDRIKFLILLPFADAVISMNGVTDHSGSLDWVLRLRKKLIMQWQGTDVLLAMERMKSGTINRKYIDYAFHITDSSWLTDEVRSLNLYPDVITFKYGNDLNVVKKYSTIKVLTYIAQNRQEFYGLTKVVFLAKKFPHIEFHVYGSSNTDFQLPENVKLNGWAEHTEFLKLISEFPIFLRITVHEGFPVTVIEAMSTGCEVLMTMPYEFVDVLNEHDDIEVKFRNIIDRIQERGMIPNQKLIQKAKTDFNKETVIKNYYDKLKDILKK